MNPAPENFYRVDKFVLTENINLLVKTKNIDNLMDELLNRNVLTPYIIDELNMIPIEEDKARALFDELKSRGPPAFEHLLSALAFTDNDDICRIINQKRNGSESQYSKIKVVKSKKRMRFNYDSNMYNMYSKPKGYALIINIHSFFDPGLNPEPRTGSYRDVANLYTLFYQLGYVVIMHYDLTKQEIHKKVDHFANMAEHATVDSTIVIVMSHGGKIDYTFKSYDNLEVHCDRDIVAPFKSKHLQGKPKIFIFQICRGDNRDHGIERDNLTKSSTVGLTSSTADSTSSTADSTSSTADSTSSTADSTSSTADSTSSTADSTSSTADSTSSTADSTSSTADSTSSTVDVIARRNAVKRFVAGNASSLATSYATDTLTSSSSTGCDSTDASSFSTSDASSFETRFQRQLTGGQPVREPLINNIFQIYSTAFDHESLREEIQGGYFVQCMCKVFAENAYRLELIDLVKETRERLATIYHRVHGFMTPTITYTADCRKFYFNPGIYGEVSDQNVHANIGNDARNTADSNRSDSASDQNINGNISGYDRNAADNNVGESSKNISCKSVVNSVIERSGISDSEFVTENSKATENKKDNTLCTGNLENIVSNNSNSYSKFDCNNDNSCRNDDSKFQNNNCNRDSSSSSQANGSSYCSNQENGSGNYANDRISNANDRSNHVTGGNSINKNLARLEQVQAGRQINELCDYDEVGSTCGNSATNINNYSRNNVNVNSFLNQFDKNYVIVDVKNDFLSDQEKLVGKHDQSEVGNPGNLVGNSGNFVGNTVAPGKSNLDSDDINSSSLNSSELDNLGNNSSQYFLKDCFENPAINNKTVGSGSPSTAVASLEKNSVVTSSIEKRNLGLRKYLRKAKKTSDEDVGGGDRKTECFDKKMCVLH